MNTQILMPALSPTMQSGKVVKWIVKKGDKVKAGDIIAEIETDKAVMELEAVDDGVVAEIFVEAGDAEISVNKPIATIITEDADLGIESLGVENLGVEKDNKQDVQIQNLTKTEHTQKQTHQTQKQEHDNNKNSTMQNIPLRQAIKDAIAEEMRRDDKVFVMGEEVGEYQGAYKVTQGLLEEFGARRVIDTPISEYGFAGVGVGAAFAGLRPIVEFMTFNFAMQAIDHIVNSAAKTHYMSGGKIKCPIVFRGPNGAAARVGAQHSQNFASWYAHVPGLIVLAPYYAQDTKALLKSAIRSDNPVVFLENEMLYGHKFDVSLDEDILLEPGKAKIVRKGQDVTIVAYSYAMTYALKAAEMLEAENINAEIIDLISLRPLDIETIVNSVKKTSRLICVDESWPFCSITSEITAQVVDRAFDYLDSEIKRVNAKDIPLPYAANLEKAALPSAEQIYYTAKKIIGKNKCKNK